MGVLQWILGAVYQDTLVSLNQELKLGRKAELKKAMILLHSVRGDPEEAEHLQTLKKVFMKFWKKSLTEEQEQKLKKIRLTAVSLCNTALLDQKKKKYKKVKDTMEDLKYIIGPVS